MLCVVHDLAEAQVGDIAPREGVPKAEKKRLEAVRIPNVALSYFDSRYSQEAMQNFVHEMLQDSPQAQFMMDLFEVR